MQVGPSRPSDAQLLQSQDFLNQQQRDLELEEKISQVFRVYQAGLAFYDLYYYLNNPNALSVEFAINFSAHVSQVFVHPDASHLTKMLAFGANAFAILNWTDRFSMNKSMFFQCADLMNRGISLYFPIRAMSIKNQLGKFN